MEDFDSKSWVNELLTYKGFIWLALLAMWGGTVRYISRLRTDKTEFRVAELIGEWFISGFAGILVAYICLSMDMSWQMTSFMVGVAGHMGGRAIFVLEARFKRFLGKDADGV